MGWWLGIGLVLGACSGGGVDLGVKGSKKIADLDQAESCAVFEGVADFTTETFELTCYSAAQAQAVLASGAEFTAQCEAAYDACVADFEPFDEDVDCADVENNTSPGCDATVRDLEICLEASLDLLDVIRRAKCDRQLGLDELAAFQDIGALPPECDALRQCNAI